MQSSLLTKQNMRWTKGYIFLFPKKGELRITKNYKDITLIAKAAKVYNTLFLNRIQPEIKKILTKKQNGFRRNRSKTSPILTIRWIIKRVKPKNIRATPPFVDFSKTFDSINRGKME